MRLQAVMDYYNRMNDFEGQRFESIVEWYSNNESSKDAFCYQYHSWSLAVARRLFSTGSYMACIRFCQQRLERSPKDLFSPRLTPAYWSSRELICSSVRDSRIPDYFKLFYMIYHFYSHAKLKCFAISSSEAAHTVILLHSIISRVEHDDNYIVDFTEIKREAILFRLQYHLKSLTDFLQCSILKWDKQRNFPIGILASCELSTAGSITFDYIYEGARAMYHAITNKVYSADLLDEFVHAAFSTSVTTNVVLSGDSGHQHNMIFPVCWNVTRIQESMGLDVVVTFWRARLWLMCAAAYIHERRYDCAIFKLGAAQNSLETIWNMLETDPQCDNVPNKRASPQTESSMYKSRSTQCVISHGVFEELDLILTTVDLRRQNILGETVDKEYIHSLVVRTQSIMQKCQLQLRRRLA
ncbi:uncharacterized protein V1513DRAFT_381305 [Lipomyces chichibuensis]|uniref:uncharacterized protein n=1 Tax=Lipomyces chichibuensis TaxID=1546026 RepID=UPI003343BB2C